MNKKMKKILVSGVIGASLVFGSNGVTLSLNGENTKTENVAFAASKNLSDISSKFWAKPAIDDLVKRKVVFGYKDGTFKPNGTVTRGQFAAFLARYLDLPAGDSKFKDLPKSAALYKDVSRAAKAGILKGDKKGFVRANDKVSRADIAVMIDRSMQFKGKFKETVELNFKDKNTVPPYALESVKKMTRYGIIQGKSNNTFAPSEYASRAVSSEFVYRMINILERKVKIPSKPPVTDDNYYKWSLEKMTEEVGAHLFYIRDEFTGEIVPVDVTKRVWERYQLPGAKLPHPEKLVQREIEGFSNVKSLASLYPQLELISYNGKALKNTDLYPNGEMQGNRVFIDLDMVIPSQPTEKGKFLVDVYSLNSDFVTYRTNDLKYGDLKEKPKDLGKDYLVNVEELFANAIGVNVAKDGAELSYGANKVVLSVGSKTMKVNGKSKALSVAPTIKNGSYYAPAREVSEALGLSTRKVVGGIGYIKGGKKGYKLEIANYPLELKTGIWE